MAHDMSAVIACPSCATKNRVPDRARGTPRCARCKTALPWIVHADDGTFEAVVSESQVPVVVDLWAPWCGPCRAISPVLEGLAREFAGRLKLVKVNVDEAQATATRFEVRGIPTLIAMRDGHEVARHVGAAPADRLRSWVETSVGEGL
jgi:thioredoxin 2